MQLNACCLTSWSSTPKQALSRDIEVLAPDQKKLPCEKVKALRVQLARLPLEIDAELTPNIKAAKLQADDITKVKDFFR